MKDFKVGDILTIFEYRGPWSSRLSGRSPMQLKYPATIEIVEVEQDTTRGIHIKGYCKESNLSYGFWSETLEKIAINAKDIYVNKDVIKFLTQHENR